MKRLIYFWNELRATFWFIPVLLILIAVLLSLTFLYVDHRFAIHPEGITRFLLTGSAKAAHDILSTISSAMIGVAGTVFSITLVALTLASSQFGPRLIRNFMYDRINQIVLGSYTATYIYCLIILNSIKDNEQFSFIPSISVLLALVATILNIILLVIFFHHIATNIQAENIIAEISTVLSKNIKDLFPEKTPQEENVDLQKIEKELELHSIHKAFHSKANGYLRYIDSDKILDIANQNDLIVELHYRQGDFLVAGQEFGKIYAKKTVEDQVIEEIQHQFIFGKSRTKEQDLEHSIHQLVEMASRALSPGINDPFTAISCINTLSSFLCYLAKSEFPTPYIYDDKGDLRLIINTLTFEGLLDASFNQIRQYSKGNPSVAIRLMEVLETINDFATKKSHKKAVQKHAAMVLNLGRISFDDKNDIADLEQRSTGILDIRE